MNQKELKELLYYDPETGILTWTTSNNFKINIGDIAGSLNSGGYIQIKINHKLYKAHRLEWLYMTGKLPKHHIDHDNHIRNYNRWLNLFDATQKKNLKNKSKYKNNTSGVTGVRWNKERGKWKTGITVKKIKIHTGYFLDKFEAVCARKSAENKYGFHENHGRLI